MKKYVWIALSSFTLGLLLAGYIFLYRPEKAAAPADVFAKAAASAATSSPNLFASALPQDKAPMDFVTIAEKIGPAVVQIVSDRRETSQSPDIGGDWPFGDDFFNRIFPQPRQSQPESSTVQVSGTGFFISPDGYILTNNHMVEKDKTTRVTVTTTAGDDYDAKIVGTDPRTDLALLKINAKNMPFAELGDSAAVKVGEWVLAIGNPLGMDNTVTAGIVSYKGRSIDTQSYQDFIQTDAAINRGNSGGPLINMKGEVIGITSSILTSGFAGGGGSIGIGFAIPSNIAKKVVVQLKDKGRVIRGRLGRPDPGPDRGHGQAVEPQVQDRGRRQLGRARFAGGKGQDQTVRRHRPGQRPAGQEQRRAALQDRRHPAGQQGRPEHHPRRQGDDGHGHRRRARARARKGPGREPGKGHRRLRHRPDRRARPAATAYRTTEGLLITEVRQGSEADRENLQAGMIILEVNRKKMTSVADFEDILKKTASGDEVVLLIRQETEGKSQDFIVTVKVR